MFQRYRLNSSEKQPVQTKLSARLKYIDTNILGEKINNKFIKKEKSIKYLKEISPKRNIISPTNDKIIPEHNRNNILRFFQGSD